MGGVDLTGVYRRCSFKDVVFLNSGILNFCKDRYLLITIGAEP